MNSINVSSFSPKIRGVPRVPSHIYHFWWGGAMVIGYRVYANTGIDDSLSLVFDGSGSPSVRSFKHTGLTPGRRYWYQVGKTWGKHMEMIGSEGSSFLRSTTEIFTYWQWIYSYNFCLWQKRGNSGSNAYHLSASFPFFPKNTTTIHVVHRWNHPISAPFKSQGLNVFVHSMDTIHLSTSLPNWFNGWKGRKLWIFGWSSVWFVGQAPYSIPFWMSKASKYYFPYIELSRNSTNYLHTTQPFMFQAERI